MKLYLLAGVMSLLVFSVTSQNKGEDDMSRYGQVDNVVESRSNRGIVMRRNLLTRVLAAKRGDIWSMPRIHFPIPITVKPTFEESKQPEGVKRRTFLESDYGYGYGGGGK